MKSVSSKKKEFAKILRDIKSVKIQGARNIAIASLRAYELIKTPRSKKILLKSRPTEPMMQNVLNLADKFPSEEILLHFDLAQERINKLVQKEIKNGDVIFTHCHSTNVVKSLIYARKKKNKFQVYNTETRPLYQGRKTARELSKEKIKVTTFVDSALGVALSGEQNTKKATKVFLGADALTNRGVINKIGSEVIAKIAKDEKIPVYIIADSWKFTSENLKLEKRSLNEVWNNAPKKIKIENTSFEFIDKKYITKIISEYGNLDYKKFLRKIYSF